MDKGDVAKPRLVWLACYLVVARVAWDQVKLFFYLLHHAEDYLTRGYRSFN